MKLIKVLVFISFLFLCSNYHSQENKIFQFLEPEMNLGILSDNFIFNIKRIGNSALITPRSNVTGNIELISANNNYVLEMELDVLNLIQVKNNKIIKPYFLFDHYWNSENKFLSNSGRFIYCENAYFNNIDSSWRQDALYDLNNNCDLLLLNLPNNNEIYFSEDDRYMVVCDLSTFYIFDLNKKQLVNQINKEIQNELIFSEFLDINSDKKEFILLQEKITELGIQNYIVRYDFLGNLKDSISTELTISQKFYSENYLLLTLSKNSLNLDKMLIIPNDKSSFDYISDKTVNLINSILKNLTLKKSIYYQFLQIVIHFVLLFLSLRKILI
jgi:hypothetical protein